MSEDRQMTEEEIVEWEAKKTHDEHEQKMADLRYLMRTPQGERFLCSIMDRGFIFKTTFVGNSYSGFNEGHRNFALMILDELVEADPEKVGVLLMRYKKGQIDKKGEQDNG